MKDIVSYIYDIPKFSKKTALSNTKEMLRRIGFDERNKKIIHVAGTNGKGSVCAYLDSILRHAGKQVGLFTSPHLVRINERIVVNGMEVGNNEFSDAFHVIKSVSKAMVADGLVHPSFFEFLFGMAMYIFGKSDVEYIILETGLGGRLDATNAINNPVLCVITEIGLDHTDILGDTYEKIAKEKAGIIKPGVPVVFTDKRPEATGIIEKVAKDNNSEIIRLNKNDITQININDKGIDFCLRNKYYDNVSFYVKSHGIYQTENASLAALAALCVLNVDTETIKKGIADTVWIGRMQRLDNGLIVDGGHNDDGITEFLNSVRNESNPGKRVLLFSAVKDKHYDSMIKKICESGLFSVIVTGVIDDARAITKDVFEKSFLPYPVRSIHCDTVREAFDVVMSMKSDDTALYAAGSLYLAGEILSTY